MSLTRAQIAAEISAQLPDNTTGLITPALLRDTVQDIADAAPNLADGDLNATAVGLGNVDNTSDANKPVSTATQTVLDTKTQQFTFVLSIGVVATVGTNKTNALIVTKARTITKAFATAKTGPTGASLIFDINVNGSTIWSTQGNRLAIVAGATYGTQTSFNTTALVEGDLLTIDLDQVGSTIAGQDITVVLSTI